MDDLVKRLHALSRYAHDDRSIGDEAADEIERLRAALNQIASIERDGDEKLMLFLAKGIARNACKP